MKKIVYIFLIMFSKHTFSENNFGIAKTNSTKNYSKGLKKAALQEIFLKPIVLTLNIEQLYLIFFMYIQQKSLNITNTLNSERNIYKKMNLLINWLEQQDDLIWYDYFSVHNQTISTLRGEILRLNGTYNFDYLCESIGKKMIDIVYARIIRSYESSSSNTNILSLIYIYQDYTKIFKEFISIDDSSITNIFNELTAIKEVPASIIGSNHINIESIIETSPTEIIVSTTNAINATVFSIIKISKPKLNPKPKQAI